MPATGVYPVFENKFKIGTAGRASEPTDMKPVSSLETFSVEIDGNVEEWNPMESEGWTRRMVTGKSLTRATTTWPKTPGAPARTATPGLSGSSPTARRWPLTAY